MDGADKPSLSLVAGKTDAQLASELRQELAPHIEGLCRLIDRARASGLTVSFNIAPDPCGRLTATIHIVKAL